MCLGDLAFFSARGSFCNSGGFGPASCFHTFSGRSTSGFLGLTQRPLHRRVRVRGLCSLGCLACCRIRRIGSRLSLGLGQ
jgi:hypothetical protein